MWLGAGLCVLAVGARVTDLLPPAAGGSVRLGGLVGERVALTAERRLLEMDEAALLAGFRSRPGNHPWTGEHVGKFLHAATMAWVNTGNPRLREKIDRVTTELIACQLPDGYLGTYTADEYWTSWDVWVHKYCLYGLLTVAEQTGNGAALEAAQKIGNLLCETFGEGEGQRDIIASGTHVGMAATSVMEPMLLLYRATGSPRYLAFCENLVRSWDQPHGPQVLTSLLDHGKVNRTANGKAYEMMSNLVGLCELYRATGNVDYLTACIRAWDDIAANQCYLTGGTSLGEHFQADGHLPNRGNVSENCAQVTWEQLTVQLLRLTGEAKYAELLETLVYNHLLGSQQPELEGICYFTPLEGQKPYGGGINCCTSSNPRGVELIPSFAWSHKRDEVTALLHAPGEFRFEVDGTPVTVRQLSDYPNEPNLEYRVDSPRPVTVRLRVRKPAWCRQYGVVIDDRPPDALPAGEFVEVELTTGQRLVIMLPMPVERIDGTTTNLGALAVRRGPLVYSCDEADNPGLRVGMLGLDGDEPIEPEGELLVGVPVAPARAPLPEGARLRLRPFHSAGASGSRYRVWLPRPETVAALRFNELMFGTESWSREGNVGGSINDGDPASWRVTFDGTRQGEDWYAVSLDAPVTIARVVYAHGMNYHDGGWFDAAAGKPRIEVKRTADSPWETIATLDSYPATTSGDRAGLSPGQSFEARFAPLEVIAVRVIGVGASGDSPAQCFSSCAELQAFAE